MPLNGESVPPQVRYDLAPRHPSPTDEAATGAQTGRADVCRPSPVWTARLRQRAATAEQEHGAPGGTGSDQIRR